MVGGSDCAIILIVSAEHRRGIVKKIAATATQRAAQPELPGVAALDRGRGRPALSPKRPSEDTSGLADVFPYYAGFAYDWARALLAAQKLPANAVILDPWNGSGTTTLAAQHEGHKAIGIDRNPVANIVARLRVTSFTQGPFLTPRENVPHCTTSSATDPLAAWFDQKSILRIRDWAEHLSTLPSEKSALAYVALFRTVRILTRSFEGSNPTWVKRAKSEDELVRIGALDFDTAVEQEQEFLACRVRESPRSSSMPVQISTADSCALPVATDSIDSVLTSPPYLTRIDYAVAYTRELALLGVDISRDRTLRSALMGTTLIRGDGQADFPMGSIAESLLSNVASHSSKASNGYYRKQTVQYLRDLSKGLDEVTRVIKPGGYLHLVVQDSYYKDIPVRLADICVEETELRGWHLVQRDPYPVRRTLTSLNKAARKYKKSEVAETVVTLRKA
ncbi:DNA methyltransferase [Streptomyces sp. MMS24-I31]|uniref:DNA methyltransferase n=1 Tax=Streptomyces sp. MMS24-I31 TaxID=3351563 RepID=UPI00389689AD